jgi:hypothetical protein
LVGESLERRSGKEEEEEEDGNIMLRRILDELRMTAGWKWLRMVFKRCALLLVNLNLRVKMQVIYFLIYLARELLERTGFNTV